MDGRQRVVSYLLPGLLAALIGLQIFSMLRSDRLYRGLNRLDEAFERSTSPRRTKLSGFDEPANFTYPGDKGDWLVWAFHVEPKTLNPISAETDIYARWITVPNIFEPLMVYDWDRIELRPHLAQSFQISPDGRQITFRLRDDIFFSDRVPVTADDVIFTYQTIKNSKIDAANLANLYIDVDRSVRVSNRTVTFYMKKPYFKALENLSFWDIGILPEHIYKFDNPQQFNQHISTPIGSGPYLFEKWDIGRQVVLRRNQHYWGPKPPLKRIVYRFIPNPIASLQALRAHKVDLVIPEPEQFADLASNRQFNRNFRCLRYWNPAVPFYYIGWNQDTGFFADRRVRLAMTHIIDRRQIIALLLKGNGHIITGPFYIHGPQNDPNIQPWPYDPGTARRLLDEAGWLDHDGDGIRDKDAVPFRFRFMYCGDSTFYNRLVKLLKDAAARVGIDLIPDPYEWSVLIERLNDRKFDAAVMGWGGDILEDPYQLWHSSQIGNHGSNYVGFDSPRADELIEQARRSLDNTERNKLYHRLHLILHEQQPYTFLFTRPTFRLLDKRFKNVIIHPLGLNYLQWYVPKAEQRYK